MSRLVEDKVLYKPSNAGLALGIVMTLAIATPALAEDTLRLAIGQRGLWNTCISEVGQPAVFSSDMASILKFILRVIGRR